MRILFVGDIVGRPGRTCLAEALPVLRETMKIDFVGVNAENAAGGIGATPEVVAELNALGVNGISMGNHTWRKREILRVLEEQPHIVRPANYPPDVPGRGSALISLPDGRKIGLINLVGRVYLDPADCPFRKAKEELSRLREKTPFILIDFHAEATSEKVALGWALDGECTAVVGTHTHVQTADERILPNGTAYITDVGMTGPTDSVIGVEKERAISKFFTGMPAHFKVAGGPVQLCGVLIEADDTNGKALSIERVVWPANDGK